MGIGFHGHLPLAWPRRAPPRPRPPQLGCHCCFPQAAEGNRLHALLSNVLKSLGSPTAHTVTVLIKRSRLKHILTVTNSCKAHGPISNNNTVTVKARETCSLFLQSISVRRKHVFLILGNRIQTVICHPRMFRLCFLTKN